jgi:hypothetical protein
VNTVLYSSVLFYVAVVEFAFGVVERGRRETVNPVLVTVLCIVMWGFVTVCYQV